MKALLLISIFLFTSEIFHSDPGNSTPSQGWSDSLNTAKNEVYLNDYEKEIICEINKVRSDPPRYAEEYLEPLKDVFDGNLLKYPGEIPIRTREGVSALNECIRVLKKASSAQPLFPSKGLHKAAELLVTDQKKYGGTGHATKSGWTPDVRVKRFGQWTTRLAENVAYGHNDARRTVISLLIDDGVPNRGHRENILEPAFGVIGVASSTHSTYRYSTAMEFADGFTEK